MKLFGTFISYNERVLVSGNLLLCACTWSGRHNSEPAPKKLNKLITVQNIFILLHRLVIFIFPWTYVLVLK